MSLEPGARQQQSITPDHSGRASPISKKWTGQRGEEEALNRDKSFRRYALGVERSLALFDTALQEWADYISFLGRLLKSLQAHPSTIAVIPSKAIVARRLAQCLNPVLPSGVHQKTLEVYNYIFSMIGKDTLSQDLSLYFPGLASTLSFASLAVRAPFLTLLETHLLQLESSALRPALKALILSLLPGLEEETSEDFERTLGLLDGFKLAIRSTDSKQDLGQNHSGGDEYFWQCFFLASITGNSRRLGALAYLTRNLPRLGASRPQDSINSSIGDSCKDESDITSDKVADVVTSPEPGLLLRCFAAGLADDQILIQRGFLDLLVTHLPLNARVLQSRVKQEDLELLLIAASGVVIRRDMSLNRRLWAWLLGPEQPSGDGGIESPLSANTDPTGAAVSSRTRYFEQYGLKPLTRAIFKMIQQGHSTPIERAKPFRICLSLMDRWEVGGLIVPEIFLPVINSVRRYQSQSNTKADLNEVLRSASVFFDGVESGLIWGEIVGLIAGAIGVGKETEAKRMDKLSLVRFILAHFNVREEEMLLVHAPTAAVAVLVMIDEFRVMTETSSPMPEQDISKDVLGLAMNVAMDLAELIPERALDGGSLTNQSSSHDQRTQQWDVENSEVLKKIRIFYSQDQGNLDLSRPPFSSQSVRELLVQRAGNIVCQSLGNVVSASGADVAIKTRLLVALLKKSLKTDSLDTERLLLSVHDKLSSSAQLQFQNFTSIITLVIVLHTRSYISQEDISSLINPLVYLAWPYLSASHPKYHVETVRNLWQLQTCLSLSNREIEAAICNLITKTDISGTFAGRDAEPGRSFAVLWTHTLQDHTDRRGSRSSVGDQNSLAQTTGVGTWEVMLSRPLFLLLDALLDERTQLFMTVRAWLQSLVGADRLFYLFVAKFAEFSFLRSTRAERSGGDASDTLQMDSDGDDLDLCLYYFQKLANTLRWSSDNTWAVLAQTTISIDRDHPSLYSIVGQDCKISLQEFFVHVCLRAVAGHYDPEKAELKSRVTQLHRAALTLLHQILLNPNSLSLSELQLEDILIDQLQLSLVGPDPFVQVLLLDVVLAALRLGATATSNRRLPTLPELKRPTTQEVSQSSTISLAVDRNERLSIGPQPPTSLVKCLQAGFSASSSRPVLDSWVNFLFECLPLYSEMVFQVLIPLVETLCSQVALVFDSLQNTFKETKASPIGNSSPESTLIFLLNGLEQVLAHGHEKLMKDEAKTPTVKTPDQPQGFFGNMVSGVFSSDAPQARTMTANNRLTVLLSFQDAVRICFTIWSWGVKGLEASNQDAESVASFNYTSLRMRNRARRLLEHLFAAEALECLETVIEIWQRYSSKSTDDTKFTVVFNLLHVLDGSKPKHTIPAIFDAIYSRTNPSALEASRKSTLTSTLADTDLAVFLVEYARSLEDDSMDEIWTDCMTFLRDILTNPFPHRQTLPSLLELASILGEKVDNTNFGEQRRMRRELGDLFLRLLTATFTTRPIGFSDSAVQGVSEKRPEFDDSSPRPLNRSEDVVGILASIAPNLPVILLEPDRVLNAVNTISTSVIGPTFRSKAFPENVTNSLLVLLYQLTRLPNTQKAWKKDLGDAFNDARFFSSPITIVENNWLPLLRQWVLTDKERMPELLSRVSSPTTAGIVFGVGATSARFEADRKTQLNLRRITTLILAAADDSFVIDLAALEEKLVDLLSGTTTSSPSSTTRAEIYMVLRALALKISPIHLASLWPTINAELFAAISSVVAADHSQTSETYNNFSVLQACKLLDVLLCIAPDDFQLHEWLFITDTIDAVYRPPDYNPVGLIDELSEELGLVSTTSALYVEQIAATGASIDKTVRRPLLGQGGIECEGVNLERKDELVGKVLRPFFSQLSIFAFERTYEMGLTDWEFCRRDLVKDLFDERGIVKAL